MSEIVPGGVRGKFVSNLVAGLLVCLAPASQSLAQLHPPRAGSKSQPAVICAGCPGNNKLGQPNAGLPTYPYSRPIVGHTGRYVDSSNTQAIQNVGFRTARAQLIRIAKDRRGTAPPRAYIQIGSALAAYSLDSFFSSKLPGGMVSIASIMSGVSGGGFPRTPPEKILKWDQYVYPEAGGRRSEWRCPGSDGQERLSDFDYDDRGYVYLAYTVFGWGIVMDDGRTDGRLMTKVVQLIAGGNIRRPDDFPKTLDDSTRVSPETIVAYKSGAKYYAIVTDKVRSTAIWNVTDPAAPKLVAVRNGEQYAMRRWERNDATRRLAYVDYRNKLHIYDYEAFILGGAAVVDQTAATGKFSDVTFDRAGNVWASENKNNIWKLTVSGTGYSRQMYTPFASFDDIKAIHTGGGFLMVAGTDRSVNSFDVRLLKVDATGPRLVDIDAFFRKYYHLSPSGYAQPGSYANLQYDVQVVPWNNKTYIFYSVFGLGDVFEIEGGDPAR
jgi:hypothetical protein